MMWAIALVVGLIVVVAIAGVVLFALGKNVPVEHEATGAIDVSASAQDAFALIDNIADQPSWNVGVTGVEMLPERNGLQTCRVRMGRNSFVLVRTKFDPPREIERTIADDRAMFSGTWRYNVTPNAGGCEVRLKEVGRIPSPIPRATMKYLFGYHVNVNKHLNAIGARLGGRGGVRKL